MLTSGLMKLLGSSEFIHIATCNLDNKPNAAPKFVLKFTEHYIYLVDYTIGMTYDNIKINPRASISLVDPQSLTGYQLNGPVEIIDKGRDYNALRKEMLKKEITLTAKRIIDDVRGVAQYDSFEVFITDRFVILKFKVDEIVEIGAKGTLKRNKRK